MIQGNIYGNISIPKTSSKASSSQYFKKLLEKKPKSHINKLHKDVS